MCNQGRDDVEVNRPGRDRDGEGITHRDPPSRPAKPDGDDGAKSD
jgi:hypothetical protein